MMIIDKEFGEVEIRRSKMARNVKISIAPSGKLRASIPYYSPDFAVQRLINHNREEIRKMLATHSEKNLYTDGMIVGKSHSLIFKEYSGEKIKIEIENQAIIVKIPIREDPLSIANQSEIRSVIQKIIRRQAKAYLPRRIQFLAEKYGFSYEKLRLSHTATRWGSCSASGTISLNIALMNLPHHLIDYVIIHELCHTRQMNHSPKFWAEVEKYDPNYRQHVQEIKKFSPHI